MYFDEFIRSMLFIIRFRLAGYLFRKTSRKFHAGTYDLLANCACVVPRVSAISKENNQQIKEEDVNWERAG